MAKVDPAPMRALDRALAGARVLERIELAHTHGIDPLTVLAGSGAARPAKGTGAGKIKPRKEGGKRTGPVGVRLDGRRYPAPDMVALAADRLACVQRIRPGTPGRRKLIKRARAALNQARKASE